MSENIKIKKHKFKIGFFLKWGILITEASTLKIQYLGRKEVIAYENDHKWKTFRHYRSYKRLC